MAALNRTQSPHHSHHRHSSLLNKTIFQITYFQLQKYDNISYDNISTEPITPTSCTDKTPPTFPCALAITKHNLYIIATTGASQIHQYLKLHASNWVNYNYWLQRQSPPYQVTGTLRLCVEQWDSHKPSNRLWINGGKGVSQIHDKRWPLQVPGQPWPCITLSCNHRRMDWFRRALCQLDVPVWMYSFWM